MGNKQVQATGVSSATVEKVPIFDNRDSENASIRCQQLLTAAKQDGVTQILLDRCELRRIETITNAQTVPQTQVTLINLSYNHFQQCPLSVQENALSVLNSISLVNTQYLTILNLSCNNIEAIPCSIFTQLRALRDLDLHRNRIKVIPEELYSLSQLTRLNVSFNFIEEISSDGLRKLSLLEYLNLSFNKISSVTSLDGLANLEELEFCRYPEIEEERAPLPSLQGVTALRTLRWERQLVNDASHIVGLTLTNLSLRSHVFTELSDDIVTSFATLTSLNLTSGKLACIPDSFATLHNLKSLYLRNNQLKELSDSICSLVGLENLDLSFNQIVELNPRIGEMSGLVRLGIARNQIKVLPDTMKNLHLKMLLCTGNSFEYPSQKVIDQGLCAIMNTLRGEEERTLELTSTIDWTDTSTQRLTNHIKGCIYGQFIGDAVGLATEFLNQGSAHFHYGIEPIDFERIYQDTHRKRWIQGDWTDDSDQMILLLESYLVTGTVNELDFANRLYYWVLNGYPTLGDRGGMGLGATVKNVIQHDVFLQDPHSAAKQVWDKSNRTLAANGAVMRTSILGILHYDDLEKVIEQTGRICRVTHTDPRCLASCTAVATCIAMILQHFAINNEMNSETLKSIIERAYEYAVKELDDPFDVLPNSEKESKREAHTKELHKHMFATSFSELELAEESAIGYTFKAMGCAFVALRKLINCNQEEFEMITTEITLEAGDADSNACVAMAVVGALIGYSNLPTKWLDNMPHKAWVDQKVLQLSK
jgi:ADP-ribosylglycohydrolase